MSKYLLLFVIALGFLAACTDAERASWGSLGEESTIQCYSGGQVVFSDESTGKVVSGEQGVYFRSKTTGSYIKTFADCVITSH